MNKLKLLLIAGACACVAQSCKNPNHTTDSKANADTLNNMKDTLADSTKSITKTLVMKVSKPDAHFAVSAADGGMAEVELGKLAGEKASDAQVKDFGAMMVKDHSAANQKLMALAKSKGITLPIALSEYEQKTKDKLAGKTGKDFDKAYVDEMIDDHKKDIQEFEGAIQSLQDADLKAFATETLPTLKMHLEAIQKVHDSMK